MLSLEDRLRLTETGEEFRTAAVFLVLEVLPYHFSLRLQLRARWGGTFLFLERESPCCGYWGSQPLSPEDFLRTSCEQCKKSWAGPERFERGFDAVQRSSHLPAGSELVEKALRSWLAFLGPLESVVAASELTPLLMDRMASFEQEEAPALGIAIGL